MNPTLRRAFSLESADVVDPVDEMEETSLALEAEEAAVVVADANKEVEDAQREEDELTHAETSMEAIAVSMESIMVENGGLSRDAAMAYTVATKNIVGEALPNPMLSLESFGGASQRSEATQMSLEGIQETIAKIWKAIKAAAQKVIAAVSDFFSKIFGAVRTLRKQHDQLKAKVDGMKKTGAKVKSGTTYKVPGAQRLQMGGVINKKIILDGVKVVNSEVADTVDGIAGLADEHYDKVAKFFRSTEEDESKISDFISELFTRGKDVVMKLTTVSSQRELPGGYAVIWEQEQEKGKLPRFQAPSIEKHPKAKPYKGEGEMDPLALQEMSQVLAAVATFADTMEKKKSQREGIVKKHKDALAIADKWADGIEKGKFGQKLEQAKVNSALRSVKSGLTQTVQRLDNFLFTYNRGLLKVVSSSLAQYEVPGSE